VTSARLLFIAGSARSGALSVKLRDAARRAAEAAGAQTNVLDLRALALSLYDGDLEARDGVPSGAAALLSISPGALGGMRAMGFMRQYLQMAFAMLVVPQQQAVGKAHEAFAPDGTLADAKLTASVATVLQSVMKLAAANRT
jgi:NAD(P)H-dependent FMN reductase